MQKPGSDWRKTLTIADDVAILVPAFDGEHDIVWRRASITGEVGVEDNGDGVFLDPRTIFVSDAEGRPLTYELDESRKWLIEDALVDAAIADKDWQAEKARVFAVVIDEQAKDDAILQAKARCRHLLIELRHAQGLLDVQLDRLEAKAGKRPPELTAGEAERILAALQKVVGVLP